VLEEDVAGSRRGGGVAEIHDVLASGATAAVTLLREDLVEFELGRVARWTGRGCPGGRRTRRVAIADDDGDGREVGRVRAGRGGALARSALRLSGGRWPTPARQLTIPASAPANRRATSPPISLPQGARRRTSDLGIVRRQGCGSQR
jgi:hypothetical protein